MKNKKQKLALFFCLILVSLMSALPHLVGIKLFGASYHSFTFHSSLTSHEEAFNYMVRTKQVLRGNFLLADQELKEYQNLPHPFTGEILPAVVMSGFSLLAGSADKGFILADFFLPPIIFFLIFYFVRLASKKFAFSLLVAFATVFVRDFMVYLPYPWPVFKFLFFSPDFIDNLVITRSFHPEVSMIFFLLALIFVYRLIVFGKKADYVLSGIFCGFLFYVYIFYWTAFSFGLFIFFLINIKNNSIRKKMFIMLLICLSIGILYFFRQYQFRISSLSHDFIFRSTGFRDEFPLPESRRFIVLSSFIFLAFLFIKKKIKPKTSDIYLNSLLFAGAIIPDLSTFLLKKDLESIHWIWVYVMPLASIYYFILIEKLVFTLMPKKTIKVLYVFLFFSFTFYAFKTQLYVIKTYTVKQRFLPEEKQLIAFLNSIKKRAVINTVLSDQSFKGMNIYIPVISSHFVYVPHAGLTISSTDEIIKRSLVAISLIKPTGDNVSDQEIRMILSNAYGFLNASYVEKNIKSISRKMTLWYENVGSFCQNYEMNFVIIKTSDEKKLQNGNCFKFKKVFQNKKFTIYENKKMPVQILKN